MLKQVSDAGDVSPSPELLQPFITRSFKHRLKERMRKRDVTLGIMIGLVAALCAGVDKARQSDLEFYDLPAFTLPTFGFGNMSRTAVRRPGIVAVECASSPPPPRLLLPGSDTSFSARVLFDATDALCLTEVTA